MDLRIQYTEGRSDGVYGWCLPLDAPLESDVHPVCVFVTHAYLDRALNVWRPKVRGRLEFYDCVRGGHRLHGMTEDFETFEVIGVNGHKGILFHWGNWGSDSEGCFCLGEKIVRTEQDRDGLDGPDEMVTNSRAMFAKFMQLQAGVERFRLLVEEHFPSGD